MEFRKFIAAEMNKSRELQPGLPNAEYMQMAAAKWQEYKKTNCIGDAKPKPKKKSVKEPEPELLDHKKFIGIDMRRLREEKPGFPNSEYMRMAQRNWTAYKKANGIESKPKENPKKPPKTSTSNIMFHKDFVSMELRRLREEQPGLPNNKYMKLAFASWNAYKEVIGIAPFTPKQKITETKSPVNASTTNPTSYSEFISMELRKLREEQPGLPAVKYMQMTQINWAAYKKTNNIDANANEVKSAPKAKPMIMKMPVNESPIEDKLNKPVLPAIKNIDIEI